MSTELLPTPETDAASDKHPSWPATAASFARKLERERDTLRCLLERCRHVNGLSYELYADIQEALNCDAHAELKAAIEDGRVTLSTFQLPLPPPGMRWHREDGWQEGDLPQGWRPHCINEVVGGEGKRNGDGKWCPLSGLEEAKSTHTLLRTRRPLTFEHAGKMWTWHRPGDPMPCDRERKVYVFDGKGEFAAFPAGTFDWSEDRREKLGSNIIGWRYAGEGQQ